MSTATPPSATVVWPLTIYYDASCPLCRTEMHTLAARDRSARLRLRDASAPGFSDARCIAAGVATPALLARIHAVDGAGRWYSGVPVFELAYAAAGLPTLTRLWNVPGLRSLAERCYPWVARNRGWLSRLHLHRPYGWLLARTAGAAEQRTHGCGDGACEVRSPADAPTRPRGRDPASAQRAR